MGQSGLVWLLVGMLGAPAVACTGSPTAPTPTQATWSISPSSMVMHQGDAVAFRISGPFGGSPGCKVSANGETGIFEVTEHLDAWMTAPTGIPLTQGAHGECVVTLTVLAQPGRATLQLFTRGYWLGYWFETVEAEATLDVVP